MKNRKLLLIAICSTIIALSVPSIAVAQENVDLVVLLDSSQSMFGYYSEVTEFVISGLVRQYMRFNDTFHLLSFSDTTQIEIAQTLKTEQDIKSALARLYLLYPLGKNTDILTALRNSHQYVSDLPTASTKFIVLITDGIHAPASSSPFYGYASEEVRAEIQKTAGKIREQGWIIKIVNVPFLPAGTTAANASNKDNTEGSQSPGAGNYLTDLSSSLGASVTEFSSDNSLTTVTDTIQLPIVTFPADLGKRDYRFKLPLTIRNPSATEITMEFNSLIADGIANVLEKKQFAVIKPRAEASINLELRFPDSWTAGSNTITFEPILSDGIRITPPKATISVNLKHTPVKSFIIFLSSKIVIIVCIALGIIAVLVLLRYIRSVHKKADSPVVDAVLDSVATTSSSLKPEAAAAKPASSIADEKSAAIAATKQQYTGRPAVASQKNSIQPTSNASDNLSPIVSDSAKQKADASILNAYKAPVSDTEQLLASWKVRSEANKQTPTIVRKIEKQRKTQQPVSYQQKIVKPGTVRVQLNVDGQNANIGTRNVKTLHAGGKKLAGSARASDFLIFLLPVPKRLAEIHFDGESIIIVPLRTELFPDFSDAKKIGFGEKIRIVNAFNKEIFLSFEHYVPALDKVNKLLHCIDTPGLRPLEIE